MTDLEETFGDSFVQEFDQERQRRRQERERASEEAKDAIAEKIVSGEEFTGTDPMIQYTAESGITHDVLLMTLPDPESGIWQHLNELDSGAVTLPMDYLGEWMSCLFNDPDEVKQMQAGHEYVIIGNLDQWEDDKGQMRDQVSPVRGVMTLDEVKKRVSGQIDASEEEPEEPSGFNEGDESDDDSEEDEEEDSSPFGNSTSGEDAEDEEEEEGGGVDEDTVLDHLNGFPDGKQDQIIELEDDAGELDDVATYIMKEEGYEEYVEEVAENIKEVIISWKSEDEEEEEDDDDEGLGLGGDEDSLFG